MFIDTTFGERSIKVNGVLHREKSDGLDCDTYETKRSGLSR